jgi:DNA-binding FrmR family transcriptional regulator
VRGHTGSTKDYLTRLRRIEDQVRRCSASSTRDAYYAEILDQVAAVSRKGELDHGHTQAHRLRRHHRP